MEFALMLTQDEAFVTYIDVAFETGQNFQYCQKTWCNGIDDEYGAAYVITGPHNSKYSGRNAAGKKSVQLLEHSREPDRRNRRPVLCGREPGYLSERHGILVGLGYVGLLHIVRGARHCSQARLPLSLQIQNGHDDGCAHR